MTATMTNTVTKLKILIAIATMSYGRIIVSVCKGCTIVNGAGYTNHPTDCDKYIQCHANAHGELEGEVRQCAFSTFWNNDALTCLPVDEAHCAGDKCYDEPDNTIFGAEGNCRGYWECTGDRSVAKCCPFGQKYDDVEGCIDTVDNECMDSCFNDMLVEPEFESEAEITCDKQEHANKGMFKQIVEGLGWVSMYCAPGTEYVQLYCKCEAVIPIAKPEQRACRAEVHLPFTTGADDQSGNGYYVENNNVEVRDGVAIFNGVNSSLVIPRFTNLDRSTAVVIKAKYSSNHMNLTVPRAIVSNADCGNTPSILISEDPLNIYYGIGTTDHKFAYDFIAQDPSNPTKDIVYEFDNGALTFTSGFDQTSYPMSGYLRNVKCGLKIGHAEGMDKFYGDIDEITIYLCNPNI